MKTFLLTFAFIGAVFCTTGASAPEKSAVTAGPQKKVVATDKPVPKSAFTIPTKPEEGHDPFYPTSDRLFVVKSTAKPKSSSGSAAIVFNGISGAENKRFAMINGYTLAEGEDAWVNTASGRVRVLLVAIKGETAVVEVAGERRELTFQGR